MLAKCLYMNLFIEHVFLLSRTQNPSVFSKTGGQTCLSPSACWERLPLLVSVTVGLHDLLVLLQPKDQSRDGNDTLS